MANEHSVQERTVKTVALLQFLQASMLIVSGLLPIVGSFYVADQLSSHIVFYYSFLLLFIGFSTITAGWGLYGIKKWSLIANIVLCVIGLLVYFFNSLFLVFKPIYVIFMGLYFYSMYSLLKTDVRHLFTNAYLNTSALNKESVPSIFVRIAILGFSFIIAASGIFMAFLIIFAQE